MSDPALPLHALPPRKSELCELRAFHRPPRTLCQLYWALHLLWQARPLQQPEGCLQPLQQPEAHLQQMQLEACLKQVQQPEACLQPPQQLEDGMQLAQLAQQPEACLQPSQQPEGSLHSPPQHPAAGAPLLSQQQDVPVSILHFEALQLDPCHGAEADPPPPAPYTEGLLANDTSSDHPPFSPPSVPSEELPPAPPPSSPPSEELPPAPPSISPEELLLHFDCPDWSRDAWRQCMVMVDSRAFPGALREALPLQPEVLTRLRARTGSADDLEVGCGHARGAQMTCWR